MGIIDIFRISKIKQENEDLKKENERLDSRIKELGVEEIEQAQSILNALTIDVADRHSTLDRLNEEISLLQEKEKKLTKSFTTQEKKISRCKELYYSVNHAINNFFDKDVNYTDCLLPQEDFTDLDLISPSIILKLHHMDVKSLKQAYRDNEKQINTLLEKYSDRYTTKANKSIYNLMVIALRAELQNILYNLKYEKLDKSIEDVKNVSAKYLKIAAEGNQSIAGTLTKFIGEIEYLFINAVKIEYNYYVKKEQAKQEQLALREQMRQEAEERKALEAEKKKIAKEEEKYNNEIQKIKDAISSSTDEDELQKLQAKILELENRLGEVIVKKEEIVNLQNGKAGTVYVISNLGSFGEDVFKVGMTRRLDPQDRINELGNASVPFKFDVHSFIFSEDAVSLENKLHQILNEKRVNKVNLRKEFFKVSLDEIESIVDEIDSTAEFNRTMAAEEFRQSISSDEIYSSEYDLIDDDLDEDE